MMSIDEKINEALNIVGDIKKEEKKVIPRPEGDDEKEIDYKYSRENFYNLIEKGQDAIEGILALAKESEHPRTYEVAGQLIKNVSEVTEKLMQLQNDMKKLKEVPNNAPKNVTNALFVGSTAELQKVLTGKGRIIDADTRDTDSGTD
ncbi:MAG: terminase [Candidatus Neomarinimicrobiota bacterium]|nr:MAG: terminase [Candidatus Neomarinimicrobiota bacterium]